MNRLLVFVTLLAVLALIVYGLSVNAWDDQSLRGR